MFYLKEALTYDLEKLGIPTDFDLCLKGYSKLYKGRYNPNNKKLTLFIFESLEGKKLLPYSQILRCAIHESTHHYQWYHEPSFKRIKGIMHNPDFKRQEQIWVVKARMFNIFNNKIGVEKYIECFV